MIQRVIFADRGQGFLWWEIDDATGRIVGCGPLQASLWANGKVSVDLATVAVGARPRFFSSATSPAGIVLLYPVVSIAPAKSGGGGVSMPELIGHPPAPDDEPRCRVCGCWALDAFWDDELGPCWWAEDDLCSHCAARPRSVLPLVVSSVVTLVLLAGLIAVAAVTGALS